MKTDNVIALNRVEPRPGGRREPVGVLDIGTTKMCCLVARPRGGAFELLGASHQLAEGLRAGEIVDVEAVEASIVAVVHEAEQQAGQTLRDVVLGVAAGRPHSRRAPIELEIGHRPVTAADLSRALTHAQAEARTGGVEVLHALPVEITLDGGQPLRDPCGMIGGRLRVGVHLICAAAAPIHNLVAAVERCHLEVAGVVAAPYASGLASLSDEEASQGALVLDLGGGVTGVARFAEGRVQEIHAVPLGGQHVTQDLAFGLSTGRAQAERLKSLYGSVLSRAGDSRQQLEVPGIGDPGQPPVQMVSRSRLTEIIRPRVEETLQLVRARIAGSPLVGRRLVLTGGASQIEGIVELAEELFDMPARIGRARPFVGGPGLQDLTAATTAAGLLTWSVRDEGGLTFGSRRWNPAATRPLAKFGQWLRENF